ncbi:MAG: pilus assembly protein TadG-related protein, partial [Candidatus Dormibacteria bacterium]
MIRPPRRNLGVPPSTRTRQQGQVMVLFSLSLLVLLLAVGIAIDGGFGLLQYRQAQNAADFAAEAGATALQSNCDGALSPAPVTGTQVVAVLDDEVNINSPAAAVPAGSATKHWTAYYLSNTQYPNGQYKPLYAPGTSTPVAVTTSSGVVPVGACGVHISVQPQWPPFIAQIMGVTQLKTVTGASAVNTVVQGGPLTSIVSLGENGAHTILMAGDGQFNVTGTIFDNANGCLDTNCDMWGRPDVIDGKQNGTMVDQGNIESYANPPWDGCFGSASNTPGPPAGSGNPPAPWNSAVCSNNNTTIKYYNWQGGYTQYTSDPLASDASLPQPSSADAYCPGQSVQYYHSGYTPPTVGGVPTYSPGVYNHTVTVTGNANFLNCSQVLGQTGGTTSYTGLYDFKQGLVLRPASGDTVTGNQVLFFTQQPPDTINGVKNQGDGEPVIGGFNGTCPPSPNNNSNDNCNAVNSPA